ncbi:hypothetical protein ACS0TY_035569 [Phlomoides rotata]
MRKRGDQVMSNGRKIERKTIEKNRRSEMKYLCFKLVSLIPSHHFNPQKEILSQQDQIGEAADYIKKLSARIEELKKAKSQLASSMMGTGTNNTSKRGHMLLPVVRVRELGSSLEVVLISGLEKKIKVHQVIRLLEEEGTEVVNVSLSNTGDKIFHTLHAQVRTRS